jgi:hypothetical protein
VWDWNHFSCLQTIVDKHNYRPDDNFTAAHWDAQRGALVVAGDR